MKYSILDAHDYSVFACSLNLRSIDRVECEAAGYGSSYEAIEDGLNRSPYCKVGYNTKTDEVDFVFGVAVDPEVPSVGIPWMLATDKLKITKSWLKHCKEVIFPQMDDMYPVLQNYVHQDNHESIRWLKWLGFTFYDVEGIPFYIFTKLGGNPICVHPQQ